MRGLEAAPDCGDRWAGAMLFDEPADVKFIDGMATRSGAAEELDG